MTAERSTIRFQDKNCFRMIDRNPRLLVVLMLTLALLSATGVRAADSQAVTLMGEHKCYVCHADDEKLVGPAFVDVAAKYRGNPDAIAIVAAHVRHGVRGEGPWHMPPHPELSPEDARTIARYILSLDQRRIHSQGTTGRKTLESATDSSPCS